MIPLDKIIAHYQFIKNLITAWGFNAQEVKIFKGFASHEEHNLNFLLISLPQEPNETPRARYLEIDLEALLGCVCIVSTEATLDPILIEEIKSKAIPFDCDSLQNHLVEPGALLSANTLILSSGNYMIRVN